MGPGPSSAIANGGLLMKPYIVKAVKDPRGNTIQQFSPQVVRQAISGDTAMAGAPREDGGPGNPLLEAGAVYIFERDQGGAACTIACAAQSN